LRSDVTPDPIDVRAREVGFALQRARDLLDELQSEVAARAAIIEGLAAQTQQAEQRATDASARAGLSEKESEAVDALLVSALKTRLAELERSARRREWGLATIVALIIGLIVGVASILISHFAFGF
jgi:F0F1-type ATP synthase assembly protein I